MEGYVRDRAGDNFMKVLLGRGVEGVLVVRGWILFGLEVFG